jgi:glucose-1-phosphate thymidylyltransferase
MIGIYYFKEGTQLAEEIAYLIDNGITKGGEYQLPDALKRMTEKGKRFAPGEVDEWMDCGNPKATIETNERVLHWKCANSEIDNTALIENSVVLPPCFIGAGVQIRNSVVGPYVSLGESSSVLDGRVERSIVQAHTHISGACIKDSMIGNYVTFKKQPEHLNMGDYTQVG